MKTIIRIEHICGNGLFRAENIDGTAILNQAKCEPQLIDKHQKKNFNTPFKDGLEISHNEFCAFKSIEQIQEWVNPEWFNEIINLGFKIWMIDVSMYKEGEHQIIFNKQNILLKKKRYYSIVYK
jgi:hypothetical protein